MIIAQLVHEEINSQRSLVSVDEETFNIIVGRLNDVICKDAVIAIIFK